MASKSKSENSNILANKQRQKELNNYMLIMGKVIEHILVNCLVETSDTFIYLEEIRQNYNKLKQAIGQSKENKGNK